MTPGTFFSILKKAPPNRACLLGISGCSTTEELLKTATVLRAQMPWAPGSRIALCGLTPPELVQMLVALDGVAEQILLIPASLDEPSVNALITKASITDIVKSNFNHTRLLEDFNPKPIQSPTNWLLATSGTTGSPKLIVHRLETLTRTTRIDYKRGGDYIWGLVYDPNRFAGLQVVLQALLSGSALALPTRVAFDNQIEVLLRNSVNALSATPTLWRKLLMDGRIMKLPLRQLTLGGETVDQSILDALKTIFPQSRIIHIYASTEAGTGFTVKDGLAGFPSDWLDSQANTPLMRVDKNNHLLIKPHLLPRGTDISSRITSDGYLDTEDLVRVEGDRVLFLGRASGAINVGGNKISPEWLEEYLRGIAGIADARVYAKSSSMTGQLVAAEIVAQPDSDTQTLRKQINRSCRQDLEAWQIPVFITFVSQLNETAAGKRERIQ